MVDPKKTSVAARNFLKRYGENAPAEAKRRAQEMHIFGRADGYATWMNILEEVNKLLGRESRETLH